MLIFVLKPGSHMSPMIGESLSVTIQGENSQRILLIVAINNGRRQCRRHMRNRFKSLMDGDKFNHWDMSPSR